MTIEDLVSRQKLRRKVQGVAAALLPYMRNGQLAVESFRQTCWPRTARA